jgi:hypothetical protein
VVRRAAIVLAFAFAPLGGCGAGSAAMPPARGDVVLVAAPVAALAALPGGALLIGALRGGPLRRVAADGAVATVRLRVPAVATRGQRGLLSLAADGTRVYASWTTPGGRLVVGRLRAGAPRIVWIGPRTTTLANGGHLALAPDGRLVIGVGDRQSPHGAVGAMLSLDPGGPAGQRPRVLSTGWSNPFAFAFTPDGRLWVADNAPGERGERLARGDLGRPREVTGLPRGTAPSGLVALPGGDLALCGFRSGRLDRYRLRASGRWVRVGTISGDCRYGVARLSDGRLAFAGAHAVRSVRP